MQAAASRAHRHVRAWMPTNPKGWNETYWPGGCVRRTLLDCKSGTDEFKRLAKQNALQEPIRNTHQVKFIASLSLSSSYRLELYIVLVCIERMVEIIVMPKDYRPKSFQI